MWVSKTTLGDELEKKYQDGIRKGQEVERGKHILFSDYYRERLEYWKGRFDEIEKPKKHRLHLWQQGGGCYIEVFDDLEEAKKRRDDLRNQLESTSMSILFDDQMVLKTNIRHLSDVEEGHPFPYTPEEIEAWAKERVEEEIRTRWMVVKLPPEPGSSWSMTPLQ